MLTPQETKAIEIMHYEKRMTIEQIANDPGWDVCGVSLSDIVKLLRPADIEANRRFLRGNTFLILDGEKRTISQWQDITGISRYTIRLRLNNGWSVKDALTTPARVQRNNTSRTK